jgi:hypothetical protein
VIYNLKISGGHINLNVSILIMTIYKKGCTLLAAASDKVYQLLAHGWRFSPGTPATSTTKTGRHDIAEILLMVALNRPWANNW